MVEMNQKQTLDGVVNIAKPIGRTFGQLLNKGYRWLFALDYQPSPYKQKSNAIKTGASVGLAFAMGLIDGPQWYVTIPAWYSAAGHTIRYFKDKSF